MIAEIGHFSLIMALVTSILQARLPLIATYHAILNEYVRLAVPLQLLSATGIIIAFASLLFTFITSEFSLALLAQHPHSLIPLLYKISTSCVNPQCYLLLCYVLLALSRTSFLCSSHVIIRVTTTPSVANQPM